MTLYHYPPIRNTAHNTDNTELINHPQLMQVVSGYCTAECFVVEIPPSYKECSSRCTSVDNTESNNRPQLMQVVSGYCKAECFARIP